MSRLTRSERQRGKEAVPVAEQKRRILIAMTKAPRGHTWHTASLAYLAFPDYSFRSPQGAALAISRTARAMCDEGLLRMAKYGYEITEQGRAQNSPSEVAG